MVSSAIYNENFFAKFIEVVCILMLLKLGGKMKTQKKFKNKPRIAIIGANESINFLILKAKEMGYETHVFAWKCDDPGEKTADVFYPIDIANKEEILDVCKTLGVIGIVSITSDFAVNTVNFVARNLGLVGNSERTDVVARNKFLMRTVFREAGLFTPWFTKVDKYTELLFMKAHKYPVIVKPTDRWSSKGVTRVDCFEQLIDAVLYATSESLTGEAIIEDFMDGPEYSAECICQDGVCYLLQITEKSTTGFPHYVETGHKQPADIPEDFKSYLEKIIKKAVSALSIENGAAHVEFKILDLPNSSSCEKEVGIIEIGARMGGDYIGTDLVRLSTGYDYISMVVDVSCGKKISFAKAPHYSYSEVKFIMDENTYNEYLIISADDRDIERAVIFDSRFDHNIQNSADRYGYYILRKGDATI